MATGPGYRDVVEWLVSRGPQVPDIDTLVAELIPRMKAVGLPVVRLWHTWQHDHPLLDSQDWIWEEGALRKRRISAGYFQRFAGSDPEKLRSVLGPVAELIDASTWHARAADGSSGYEVVDGCFEAGASDYVVIVAPGSDGLAELLVEGKGAHGLGMSTWALAIDGGLDEAAKQGLHRIHDAFSLASRLHLERGHARTLLHTFLGRDTGDRVLEGRTRRGDKLQITAAIAFTDLRGFSALSEHTDSDTLLDLLDDAFEVQVGAIEAHGGHVLSFLGDGILAIWPDDESADGSSCDRALAAARAIEVAVAERNEERGPDVPPIRYGIALHWGEVVYGNIGAPHRLSFTVVGPAVNRTARLEGIGAKMGVEPTLSRAFADRTSEECVRCGSAEGKGVGELEVWTTAAS